MATREELIKCVGHTVGLVPCNNFPVYLAYVGPEYARFSWYGDFNRYYTAKFKDLNTSYTLPWLTFFEDRARVSSFL